MSAQKSMPSRRCLGCNEMKDKKDLLRIVRGTDGSVVFDSTGKANGRGAYICRSAECLKRCRKGGRLEKAFRAKIDDNVYDDLLAQLNEKAGDTIE